MLVFSHKLPISLPIFSLLVSISLHQELSWSNGSTFCCIEKKESQFKFVPLKLKSNLLRLNSNWLNQILCTLYTLNSNILCCHTKCPHIKTKILVSIWSHI